MCSIAAAQEVALPCGVALWHKVLQLWSLPLHRSSSGRLFMHACSSLSSLQLPPLQGRTSMQLLDLQHVM